MTDQLSTFTEKTASSRLHLPSQKLEHLLKALNQLKSDISGVEALHPGFGSELSSLCDTVIADLNSLNSHNGDGQQADRNDLNVIIDKPAAAGESLQPRKQNANPISVVIDKAGSHLITGLDKTGDGIIFILGKLFTGSSAKANSRTSAESDL